MVQIDVHLGTGLPGLDRVLRGLIPGDNIVWRIDSVADYVPFVQPYVQSALDRGKQLIYFRFGTHQALMDEQPGLDIHRLDPRAGIEAFISSVYEVIETVGHEAWFVFDCISELAAAWRSDMMLGNFFRLTCPYLYDVNAIAYFGLMRNSHPREATNLILNTTQVFLDVYRHQQRLYIHPIKVQQRHSSKMYMLHSWQKDDFMPVAESSITAEILSEAKVDPLRSDGAVRRGIWHGAFQRAEKLLESSDTTPEEAKEAFRHLLQTAITRDPRMLQLLEKYWSVEDALAVGRRIVGTGLVGGKAIGMLLARAILNRVNPRWREIFEAHDSFYIGSDVFYSFLVDNGLWWVIEKHRDPEHFLHDVEHARHRIVVGEFPARMLARFQTVLDYFGQSPIIVRSSSLLEDNFGHSFSGKYASVFLANQGSRDQRLHDFVSAVRTVYSSTLSEEALHYRARRGMLGGDEQMAVLVQRVSGIFHDRLFLPDMAGVGYSYNPYVWSKGIDPEAGVLRLVLGLGTRAVDRNDDDYPQVIALNAPSRRPAANYDDMLQYVQRRVDVLDLEANQLVTRDFEKVVKEARDLPLSMVASCNTSVSQVLANQQDEERFPWALTFDPLLKKTDYVTTMREMLSILEDAYGCPVDVEFTTNFLDEKTYRVNLVQCRPLQVCQEASVDKPPEQIAPEDLLLEAHGAVIGHGRICNIHRIIYVEPSIYGEIPARDRYSIARLVGELVRLKGARRAENIMLLGPGRWGTSTPSLGVPITFNEISMVSVLGELVLMRDNLVPDVSLGTHFFNDLVEADILYFAFFPGREGNTLNTQLLKQMPNQLATLIPDASKWTEVVKVIDAPDGNPETSFVLNADALEQNAICYREASAEHSGDRPL